jgi:hypothetical protein
MKEKNILAWSEIEISFLHPNKQTKKQTPWLLAHSRTIPTERLPLVGEI